MLGTPTGMMMRVPVCFSPLAHLNTFKGRAPHQPGDSPSFKKKARDLYQRPWCAKWFQFETYPGEWTKKSYLIGVKSIVPDFASALEPVFTSWFALPALATTQQTLFWRQVSSWLIQRILIILLFTSMNSIIPNVSPSHGDNSNPNTRSGQGKRSLGRCPCSTNSWRWHA